MQTDDSFYEISLQDLWLRLKRHIPLIIAFALAAMVVAFFISSFMISKTYVASAKFYIDVKTSQDSSVSNELSALNYAQRISNTYVEMLKTNTYTEIVVNKIPTELTVSELKSYVSYNSISDSELLQITARTKSPQLSFEIATAISETAPESMNMIQKNAQLVLIDPPQLPKSHVSPNVNQNTILGFVVGLFLGVMLALVLEQFSVTIKNVEDIERKIKINVLAVIPKLDDFPRH